MTQVSDKNPIVRLLDYLPKQLADEKRKAIDEELHQAGKFQHYRQSVRRENWNMADTHVKCATILMKHLGLSLGFFTASPDEQQREVARLITDAYGTALVGGGPDGPLLADDAKELVDLERFFERLTQPTAQESA